MRVFGSATIGLILSLGVLASCARSPWEPKPLVPLTEPQQTYEDVAPATSPATAGSDESDEPVAVENVVERQPFDAASKPATSRPRKLVASQPDSRPVSTRPEVVAASVLQVNDEFITVQDVLQSGRTKFRDLTPRLPIRVFRPRAQRAVMEVLRDMKNEYMVYQEANNRLEEEQKKAIDREMDETLRDMVTKAGGSRTRLENLMKDEGATLEQALALQRRHLVATLYLQSKFQPMIYTTRKMLWEHYQKNVAQFQQPRKVQMQLLAVSVSDFLPADTPSPTTMESQAAHTKAREKMDAVLASARGGTSFTELVRDHSTDPSKDDDGIWPLMAAGSLKQAKVEAEAFKLKEGDISGVIEDEDTFYLVKALKVQPASTQSFEQAQIAIEDKLRRQQYRKLADEYYLKLLKTAVINIADDFVDRCVDAVVEKYWDDGGGSEQ